MATINTTEPLVLISKQKGVAVIPAGTPLARLNYFDGKFLRASDLKAEQDYLRQLVHESNRADGPGVAHGFDLTRGAGDTLTVGQGLAIDYQGRVLLLPREVTFSVADLIAQSAALDKLLQAKKAAGAADFADCQLVTDTPPASALPNNGLYVIVLSHAEALCGEEDVFGKLCEEACSTSTDRPFILEGVIIRAVPLPLNLGAIPAAYNGAKYLRTRAASAYYRAERQIVASQISGAGLKSDIWCFGADPEADRFGGVPIGVIARAGQTTLFLDAWTARRERMDTPARRYWQWRMLMRPWDVYLAQILQFQCQLHDLLGKQPLPDGNNDDPCQGARGVIEDTVKFIDEVRTHYTAREGATTTANPAYLLNLPGLFSKLSRVKLDLSAAVQERLLINGGILELPSAGYLPVTQNTRVNQQVRRLLGEGVDLRFCVVRPDYVAHALEEAQHMERISLIEGLADETKKPQVDILVPDGEIIEQARPVTGRVFEATVSVNSQLLRPQTAMKTAFVSLERPPFVFHGAARMEATPAGGGAFYLSCAYENPANVFETGQPAVDSPRPVSVNVFSARGSTVRVEAGLWIELSCERDVFQLNTGDRTNVNARGIIGAGVNDEERVLLDVQLSGSFFVLENTPAAAGAHRVKGRFDNARFSYRNGAAPGNPVFVSFDVTVELRGGSAVAVDIAIQESHLLLQASWAGSPMVIDAGIFLPDTTGANAGLRPLARANPLRENNDVLLPGNAIHQQARNALDVIADALDDASFATVNARLLFPPAPRPVDELLVRAATDWVLFHRRRTKNCSEGIIASPPPLTRRYRLWHLPVPSLRRAEPVIAALQQGENEKLEALLTQLKLRFVDDGMVEFEGGVATLRTAATEIQTSWQSITPGNHLLYSAIASRGEARQEDHLALNRLANVENAIRAATGRDTATLPPVVLPAVPTVLQQADADGVIILLTTLETNCQQVYRIHDIKMFETAVKLAVEGQMGTVTGQQLGVLLGEALFTRGTANTMGDTLEKIRGEWSRHGNGDPARVAVISRAGELAAAQNSYAAQASAIQQALGGEVTPEKLTATQSLPTECPAITLIGPRPVEGRVARIFIYRGAPDDKGIVMDRADMLVRFNPDSSLNNVPRTVISVLTGFGMLDHVSLSTQEANADGLAQKRLTEFLNKLRPALPFAPLSNNGAGALSLVDRGRLPSDITSVNDIIFMRLG
ncbi:MAG: hypothetical protein ACKV2V_19715 [Blastocatellia bacterium]